MTWIVCDIVNFNLCELKNRIGEVFYLINKVDFLSFLLLLFFRWLFCSLLKSIGLLKAGLWTTWSSYNGWNATVILSMVALWMSMIIFCISMMFVNTKLMILLLQFTFFLLVEIIILLSEGARVGRNGIPRVLKRSQNHCKQTIQETQLVLAKPLVRYPPQKERQIGVTAAFILFLTPMLVWCLLL